MKKCLAFILAILVGIGSAGAVKFTWDVDFAFVFDNRECDHDVTPTETIIFTKLAPQVGLSFGGHHNLSAGAVWTQPIGNRWDGYRIDPTLYYRYEGDNWSGSVGMFPRRQLQQELPDFLWGDSLAYFQNNIRGALLQYRNERGFFDVYLDWRQLQTETRREAFNIVFHGKWHPGGKRLFVGGHLLMNHYALTRHSGPDQHIVDNFMVNPYVGIDLSHVTVLDSLMFRGGPLMSIERNRANGGWKTPLGAWVEINARWRRFFLKNTFYAGGVQMPSYDEFGGALYQGNPFYSRKFYNRTDVGFRIIGNKWVNLDAMLDFNCYSHGFIFYQKVVAEVTLPAGRQKR